MSKPKSFTLIVDGERMRFDCYYFDDGECMATIYRKCERDAHRAEIALKFSGGEHAYRGWNQENERYFAVACFAPGQVPQA